MMRELVTEGVLLALAGAAAGLAVASQMPALLFSLLPTPLRLLRAENAIPFLGPARTSRIPLADASPL